MVRGFLRILAIVCKPLGRVSLIVLSVDIETPVDDMKIGDLDSPNRLNGELVEELFE